MDYRFADTAAALTREKLRERTNPVRPDTLRGEIELKMAEGK